MAGGKQVIKKVELYDGGTGRPIRLTVVDGTQISKGIALRLTDPFTASAVTAVNRNVPTPSAGIAAMDKEASDGSTSISVWTQGRFEGVASGAISVGMPLVFLVDSYIAEASYAAVGPVASGAAVIGTAMEAATDGETINFKLNL